MSNDNFYNHRIIAIERTETSGSGQSGVKYPMWKCRLEGGKSVNVFKHTMAARNTHALFEAYHPELDAMGMNEVVMWTQHPIAVHCIPDGNWLKVATVAPRPEGAKPDEEIDNTATQRLARAGVQKWAGFFLIDDHLIMDIETADDTNTSEVLSISVISTRGETIYKSLIKPTIPDFVNRAEHVNGITIDMLKDAPTLADIYQKIVTALSCEIVAVYNADFDIPVLQHALIRSGLQPVAIMAAVCVMKQFAMYRGEWNFIKQSWRWAKLGEAAAMFGIKTPSAHEAEADCITTLEIIKAMAAGTPLEEVEPF